MGMSTQSRRSQETDWSREVRLAERPARELFVFSIRDANYNIGLSILDRALVSADTRDPKTGRTLLHVAAAYSGTYKSPTGWVPPSCSGARDAVFGLIYEGANVNARDKNGNTPLILACKDAIFSPNDRDPDMTVVKKLLYGGGNAAWKNRWGFSALGYALERDNPNLLRLLYFGREETNCRLPRLPSSARNPGGKSTAARLG